MQRIFREPYPHFRDIVNQMHEISRNLCLDDMLANPDGQFAIQTNVPGSNDWKSGTGKSAGRSLDWEKTFCHLNSDLTNSPIDNYLNWLNIPVYRTRLMVSRPRSCYSLHRDYSPRLHLPLITNDQCNFLISEPLTMFHLPADGHTYWVDTRLKHTFLNGSLDARLHIVMIVEK